MNLTEEQKVAIKERLQNIVGEFDSEKKEIDQDLYEYADKVDNLPNFIESVDDEFEKLTGITKKDISFLVFA